MSSAPDKVRCSHCKRFHPRDLMSVNSKNKKGDVSYYWCRECNTERARRYRKTPRGRRNIFNAVYRSIKKLQFKQDARLKVYWAVKKGKLARPKKCSICKMTKALEGHHSDYSRPLDVVWVCRQCHKLLDRTDEGDKIKLQR